MLIEYTLHLLNNFKLQGDIVSVLPLLFLFVDNLTISSKSDERRTCSKILIYCKGLLEYKIHSATFPILHLVQRSMMIYHQIFLFLNIYL